MTDIVEKSGACFCDRPVAECTLPHCKKITPPDADWLRRKVETDPDIDCEASTLSSHVSNTQVE
jgi:hypothetical protein